MAENPKNAALQRKWRKTARGKKYMKAYNKANVKKRVDCNRAHRQMTKKLGEAKMAGKSIHHADGNTSNGSAKNLKVAKRYHGRRSKAEGGKNSKVKKVK